MPFPASHPALERALSERGYEEPTSVQAAVLSEEAAGRDGPAAYVCHDYVCALPVTDVDALVASL